MTTDAAEPRSAGLPRQKGRPSAVAIEHAGVLAAYALLALVVTYPVVLHARDAIAMDPQIAGWTAGDGDPWHYVWGFWYVGRALTTFPPPLLWTDLVFYPLGFDIPFLPGVGLILGPAALLAPGLGLVLTYNVLWWASFALAGYTMYLLVRALARDRTAAFVCGALFTFSSYRLIHSVEHLPIVMASFLVPLFALALLRAGRRPTAGRHAACALVLAASAGISWYCTVTLLVYLGVALAVAGWERGFGAFRALRPVPLLCALGTFVLTVSPFVLPLMLSSGRDSIVNRPLVESTLFSADLLAFFVPSPRNPLLGGLTEPLYRSFTGNPYEQTVYLGYVMLALAVGGVLSSPRAATRPFRVSALTAFVLALGPFLHVAGTVLAVPLPYLLVRHVPFVKGARVPSRFTELLLMSLIVLAGLGLAKAWARRTRPGKLAVATLVLVVGLLETALAPFPLVSARTPAVYADIGRTPQIGTLLELPLDRAIIKYHYYQTVHGQRMLVGNPVRPREKYASYPAGVPLIPYLEDPKLLLGRPDPEHARRDALRLVDFFDLRHVVIHGEYLDPLAFERLDRFVADNFPHAWRRSEGTVIAYSLTRTVPAPALWPERYVVDFGGPAGDFALVAGWSRSERWEDDGPTMQWTAERESFVVVALGAPVDRTLELRLLPFVYPGSPAQTVTIGVNGVPGARLVLTPGWAVYRVSLPATAFRSGLNTLTFRYGYARSPADVVPGGSDPRTLAVAFDYLALGPDR